MEKKKKITKSDAILKHLMRYGSISDPTARERYHTNRLSGYICVFRKRGHKIETVWCTGKDEYGKHRYAKYNYIKEA